MAYLGALVMVAVLCVGSQARWQSIDSELDSLLCSPRNYPGVIIDIHESMDKGADLLDGVWAESAATCMSGCCKTRGCDLALFKNQGTSKTGKNCYYVGCGEMENCVMVQHSSFTTISFLKAETRTGHAPRIDHTPSTATPTTQSVGVKSLAASSASVSTEHVTPPTTPSVPDTVEVGNSATSAPSDTATNEDASPPTTGKETEQGSTAANEHSSPPTGKDGPGKYETGQGFNSGKGSKGGSNATAKEMVKVASIVDDDGCGQYGCDGSGMVAVVVVGVICFAIVLVVGAILLKKVVDDRRRRKFRNVDYLINGMYT